MIKLCDYGCGQEAKYQFKNGKWCCSNSHNKCSLLKEINIQKNKNKKFSENHLENLRISRNKRKMKLWSEDQKKKLIRNGSNNPMFNKHHSEKTKKLISLNSTKLKHSEEFKEKLRNRMINGGHSYVSSFIKKISKEEKQLREMVKELYIDCVYQFKVFRYEIDVAIPKYKIAIEFDGWFHFDSEEHKIYHKNRQEKIEKEGWKFLRYNIFEKFPDIKKLKNDIEELNK